VRFINLTGVPLFPYESARGIMGSKRADARLWMREQGITPLDERGCWPTAQDRKAIRTPAAAP
jgi:hypothetical protein